MNRKFVLKVDGIDYNVTGNEWTTQKDIDDATTKIKKHPKHKNRAASLLFERLQKDSLKQRLPDADEQTINLAFADTKSGMSADIVDRRANLRTNTNRHVQTVKDADTPLSKLRLGMTAISDVGSRKFTETVMKKPFDELPGATYQSKTGDQLGLSALGKKKGVAGFAGRLAEGLGSPDQLLTTVTPLALTRLSSATVAATKSFTEASKYTKLATGVRNVGVVANSVGTGIGEVNKALQIGDMAGSLPFAISDRQRFVESNLLNAIQLAGSVKNKNIARLQENQVDPVIEPIMSLVEELSLQPKSVNDPTVQGRGYESTRRELPTEDLIRDVYEGHSFTGTFPEPFQHHVKHKYGVPPIPKPQNEFGEPIINTKVNPIIQSKKDIIETRSEFAAIVDGLDTSKDGFFASIPKIKEKYPDKTPQEIGEMIYELVKWDNRYTIVSPSRNAKEKDIVRIQTKGGGVAHIYGIRVEKTNTNTPYGTYLGSGLGGIQGLLAKKNPNINKPLIQNVPQLEVESGTSTPSKYKGGSPLHQIRSNTSVSEIPEVGGKTLNRGSLEAGVEKGGGDTTNIKEIDEALQSTKSNIFDRTNKSNSFITSQNKILKEISKERRVDVQTTTRKLVDRIEMPFNDPKRLEGLTQKEKDFLSSHDSFMESSRQYVIGKRGLGADFGITDKGYIPHFSEGRYVLTLDDGTFIGRFKTVDKASRYAYDNPNSYAKLKVDDTPLGYDDIPSYMKQNLGVFAGTPVNLKKREGTALAYKNDNYGDIISSYTNRITHGIELQDMEKGISPHIQKLEENGFGGVAEQVRKNMEAIRGGISPTERYFGEYLEKTKLGAKIELPQYALRNASSMIRGVQSALKLAGIPKSFINNAMQPVSTLFPYVTAKDFAGAYTFAFSKEGRKVMKENGVTTDAPKNMELKTDLAGQAKGALSTVQKYNFQTAGSAVSSRVGYAYGYKHTKDIFDKIQKGEPITEKISQEHLDKIKNSTPDELDALAHKNGLRWKEKVEYDSTVWNAPPALRGWLARSLFQYKTYMVKNAEEFGNYLRRGDEQAVSSYVNQVAKGFGTRSLLSGSKGFIHGKLIAAGIVWAIKSANPEMSDDDVIATAETAYLGMGNYLGADLSGSFGLFDSLYGRTNYEKVGRFVSGTTGGTIIDAITAIEGGNRPKGRIDLRSDSDKMKDAGSEFLKNVTPLSKIVPAISQIGKSDPVNEFRGEEETITPTENFIRALGFTPSRQVKKNTFKDVPNLDSLFK